MDEKSSDDSYGSQVCQDDWQDNKDISAQDGMVTGGNGRPWRLAKLSMQVARATSPGTAWFTCARLVLTVGGPGFVNAFLVARLGASPKVMTRLATIPNGKLACEHMDGLNLPSAVHNMDNIHIKGLSEVRLDTLKGRLGFEMAKIDYRLFAEILKKLKETSEVIVGCLCQSCKDIHCHI